jgi:uncharacterized RDD family membrane protein YckC
VTARVILARDIRGTPAPVTTGRPAFAGQLLIGVWLLLFSRAHRSVGDYLAGTVVVHDPDRGSLPGPRH